MDSFVLGVQLLLAVVFATAGVAKLLDQAGSRTALEGFGVPERVVPAAGMLLPLVELATAVALVIQPTARLGAAGALLLLLAFIGGIARAMACGEAPTATASASFTRPRGPRHPGPQRVLGGVSGVVVIARPAAAFDDWVAARSAAELVAVALGVVATYWAPPAFGFGWRFAACAAISTANGRGRPSSARTAAPRERARFRPVPHQRRDVSLDTLSSGSCHRPVLRQPLCGPCATLLPDLGRWQTSLAYRLTMAFVSSGSIKDNQWIAEKHGWQTCWFRKGRGP